MSRGPIRLRISSVKLYEGTPFTPNRSSKRTCISGERSVTIRRSGLSASPGFAGALRRICGIVRIKLDVVAPYSRTSSQKREALNLSVSTILPPTDSIAMQVWQSAFT
jgi:hypothetical protein